MKSYDINNCKLNASKHFRNRYMRKWNWNFVDLRDAIKNAYRIEKVGKKKYEAYADKKGSKKIIFVYYFEFDEIYVISGSEGN